MRSGSISNRLTSASVSRGAYFLFGHLLSPLCLAALDELGQCFDVGEVFAQVVVFTVELEAEGFLYGQTKFQCIN